MDSAWFRNGQVRFARHAEARRWADISWASTHMVDTPAHFGAWRDLKRCILGLTEEFEDRLRDPDLPIRILLPEYVPAMCAADLTAQAPGDQAWDITEDMVRAPTQLPRPERERLVRLGTATRRANDSDDAYGSVARSPGFDADVDFLAFPEGTWVFLDGGSLDLGIVRDSALNAANKFQTFFECWETVAQLAPFSYRVTISLCADGACAGPERDQRLLAGRLVGATQTGSLRRHRCGRVPDSATRPKRTTTASTCTEIQSMKVECDSLTADKIGL